MKWQQQQSTWKTITAQCEPTRCGSRSSSLCVCVCSVHRWTSSANLQFTSQENGKTFHSLPHKSYPLNRRLHNLTDKQTNESTQRDRARETMKKQRLREREREGRASGRERFCTSRDRANAGQVANWATGPKAKANCQILNYPFSSKNIPRASQRAKL